MDVISKIKKLLRLADTNKNSNIKEAAAAAAKAQKLMEKHRIYQTILDCNTKINLKLLEDSGKPENWKLFLISVLAKNNGCYLIKSEFYHTDKKIYLVGEEHDINSIQCLYTYTVFELNKLCLIEMLKIKALLKITFPQSFINSFYIGAISIINEKLEHTTQQVRKHEFKKLLSSEDKEVLNNTLSKIDTRINDAKNWVQKNLNVEIEKISINSTNDIAFKAGQNAAKNISLDAQFKH